MKVAYVDVTLSGHHVKYLTALFEADPNAIAILPQKINQLPAERQFVVENTNALFQHPILYFRWLNNVYNIIKDRQINVVHFLYGDAMVRYFGFGMSKFKDYKRVVTFHQIRRHWLKDLSFWFLCEKFDVVVVHTKKLKNDLYEMGIKNVKQIDYPCFLRDCSVKPNDLRSPAIQKNAPILLMIGILARYKGLDLLVDALHSVRENYHLIVAGYNQEYHKDEIQHYKEILKGHVTFDLHYLSEGEYVKYLSEADFIVLPYSNRFDGASGPLTDAVQFRKPVIASDQASLGNIVRKNRLGVLFETGNVQELRQAIESALQHKVQWNTKAEQYRENIVDLHRFVQKNQALYRE